MTLTDATTFREVMRLPAAEAPQPGRWYVAHNSAGRDDRAARILRENDFEIYIPMTAEMKVLPQRKLSAKQRRSTIPRLQRVLKPLFPRYFFVQLDFRAGWRTIFNRAGLHGVLAVPNSARRLPAEVDPAIISSLKSREINGAIEDVQKLVYEIGETVRISGGALAGINGIVQDCPPGALSELDEAASIKLLVALLGRQSVVELSIFDVEKV